MNSKFKYIIIIIYLVSLTMGVFIGFAGATSDVSIFSASLSSFFSPEYLTNENFLSILISYIKNDFIFVLSIGLLSVTYITVPISILLTTAKVFSMGFSAGFIACTFKTNTFIIILIGIIPRAIIKAPLYFLLALWAINFSKTIHTAKIKNIKLLTFRKLIIELLLIFFVLSISSLLEVALLLLVL